MPIIGKIHARLHRLRVETMPVGMTAMIDVDELMVTKNIIYLHIEAQVLRLEEGETIEEFLEMEPFCVPIKRIGTGLTENDYEIDFSRRENTEEIVILETPVFIQNQPEESRRLYITFTDGEVCIKRKGKREEKTIEDLQKDLEVATKNEDWDEAAVLRDKIEEMKNAKK